MRTRDRLDELRQLSGACAALYNGGAACCDSAERVEFPSDALTEQHLRDTLHEAERAVGWIHELCLNTQLVRRLHADPTYHNNRHLQEQLDSAVTSSNALGLKIGGALRQLEARAVAGAGAGAAGGAGGAAARVARLQASALRRRYGDALLQHHAALQELRDAQRDLLHQQIKLTNLAITDEECERLLDNNNVALFVDNVEAETRAARLTLREAETRHAELQRVERALLDVRDLFQHLAHLVASQQEQIDSVEYFALQASEHVESGHQDLLKGQVSKNKSRKKKLSLIICLLSGFAVVLFVLIVT